MNEDDLYPVQDALFEIEPEWDEDAMYDVAVRWFRRLRNMYLPHEEMYKFITKQWNAEFLRHVEAKRKPYTGEVWWHPLDRPESVG